MKKILVILLALTLCFAFFACTPSDKPLKNVAGSCSLVVECKDLLAGKNDFPETVQMVIPEDGIFLMHQSIEFYEGETAHDLLLRIAKQSKLPVDFAETQYGAYIKGIGSLYATDAGPSSGWLYTVNGESLQVAADAYKLKAGDEVRFYFVRDFSHGM